MKQGFKVFISKHYKEVIFQLILSYVLFIFYSNSQKILVSDTTETNYIIPFQITFFCNYMLAAMIINYTLIPKLYLRRKFKLFYISLIALLVIVILLDEFILEKIYFPKTRGTYFPGVLFTLIETLPVISLFIGFKFAWDYNKKQKEIESLKNLVQESELQFLKSQINPHFLFNNLNNLYAYAIENSPKTPSIILELSSVLRYMLYDCKENYVVLEKEIEHLKNYTALNELQIEERGTINFYSKVESKKFLIAPLILNVFIENAFKHSTTSQSENILVDIHINVDDQGVLTFTCKNSFSSVKNDKRLTKGIGLINVKKRLDLIYPKHELKITETHNMFSVELFIKLNDETRN